jgi:hypothetical protein
MPVHGSLQRLTAAVGAVGRIRGKQGVEIGPTDFPQFFDKSWETTAISSLMDFSIYRLFQLCFRQIKQAI